MKFFAAGNAVAEKRSVDSRIEGTSSLASRWIWYGRVVAGRRGVAAAIGIFFAIADVAPAHAAVELGIGPSTLGLAAAFYAKKKKKKPAPEPEPGPRMTPDSAEPKRQAIRDAAKPSLDSGDFAGAADKLESNAEQLGDPVTMLEAGEARLEAAKKDRNIATAEASIETSKRALDMLHFYAAVNNGEATSDWLVIEPGDASGLIERGDGVVSQAETLIDEIEAENASKVAAGSAEEGKKKRKKRERGDAKPGTGMIAAGSIFTAVGVGGVSMVIAGTVISASKQNEVEKFMPGDPEVDDLDAAGKRANLIAYIGAGVAVAGIAIGLPLLILGVKKRKQAGSAPPSTASVRRSLVVAPTFAPGAAALSLRGRF
jgi:hypothetical protein